MLTKCQEKALKAMKKGYNVHLFGDAGTGKNKLLCRIDNAIWDSEVAWIDKADSTAIILRVYDNEKE